jgi:excisionase family DNA binding protein
MDAEER